MWKGINFFLTALVLVIGFSGNLNAQHHASKKGLPLSGGTAFTCPANKWSGIKTDFYYHFTLAHIKTQDPKIVLIVRNAIKDYISDHIPKTGGHRSLSWDQPGKPGKFSLFFTGEAADFKRDLHDHLMQNPVISPYLSSFISAHVDVRGDFSTKLYREFTVDQIIERKTP